MRHLLLVLPFALLPFTAQANDQHDHDHNDTHASLAAHEHGAAQLNAALDGDTLELEFDSPAANLLGFEHAPSSDAQRAKVTELRAHLEQPERLFGLAAAAGCSISEQAVEGSLLQADKRRREQRHHDEHSDIQIRYRFSCAQPEALRGLDLRGLFEAFPGTEKIQAQLIGPGGQQGVQLEPGRSEVNF